jgi:hypothetical protein
MSIVLPDNFAGNFVLPSGTTTDATIATINGPASVIEKGLQHQLISIASTQLGTTWSTLNITYAVDGVKVTYGETIKITSAYAELDTDSSGVTAYAVTNSPGKTAVINAVQDPGQVDVFGNTAALGVFTNNGVIVLNGAGVAYGAATIAGSARPHPTSSGQGSPMSR